MKTRTVQVISYEQEMELTRKRLYRLNAKKPITRCKHLTEKEIEFIKQYNAQQEKKETK